MKRRVYGWSACWSEDHRISDLGGGARRRQENGGALIAILDEVLITKTRAEWSALFDAAGVFWVPSHH
jgi:crotonobetainyl-CoA:carnitine CoA-transferase CaiB-like acyl-CoA transferase